MPRPDSLPSSAPRPASRDARRTLARFAAPAAVVLALLGAWGLGMASRPPATPTAVAVVHPNRVLDSLAERTVREDQLKGEIQKLENERIGPLNRRKAVLEAEISELQGAANIEDDPARLEDLVLKQVELNAINAQAESLVEGLTRFIEVRKEQLRQDLFRKISATVARIADANGYDIVLVDDRYVSYPEVIPQGRALSLANIMYFHDDTDISDEVITFMNNEFNTARAAP